MRPRDRDQEARDRDHNETLISLAIANKPRNACETVRASRVRSFTDSTSLFCRFMFVEIFLHSKLEARVFIRSVGDYRCCCETGSFVAQESHAVQRVDQLQQKLQQDMHRRRP